MPATIQRRATIFIGYDASQVLAGVPTSRAALSSLNNELRGIKNEFASSGGDARQYATALESVRSRAMGLAEGLDRTSTEYAQLTGVAAQATREIQRNERAMQAASSQTSRYQTQVQQTLPFVDDLRMGIGNLVTGAAILGIGRGTVELTRFGDSIRKGELALLAYSGTAGNAERNIQAVQRATEGMVTRFEAAQTASSLLTLRLANNSQEIERFTRIASQLGAQRGLGLADSLEQVSLILANQSFLRLDSIGVSAAQVRTRFEELKQTMGDEDAFRMAFLEVAEANLSKLNEAGFTTATSLGALEVAFKEVREGAGVALSEVLERTVIGLGAVGQMVGITTVDFRALGEQAVATALQIGGLNNALLSVQAVGAAVTGTQQLEVAYSTLNETLARTAGISDQVRQAGSNFVLTRNTTDLNAFTSALNAQAGSAYLVASAFLDAAMAKGIDADAAADLYQQMTGLTTITTLVSDAQIDAKNTAVGEAIAFQATRTAALDAAYGVRVLKDELDRLNNVRTGNYGRGGTRIDPRDFQERRATEQIYRTDIESGFTPLSPTEIAIANRRIQYWEKIYPEAVKTGGARGVSNAQNAARELEKTYEQSFNNIRGFVDRALSFNSSVDSNDFLLDRFGLRNQNASDELVRQITDVRDRALEGVESPWLKFFPELNAGDSQEIAARAERLLRDVRAGTRTDLLDPEKFKQDVRELILAQRELDAFKDRITKELLPEFSAGEIQVALGEKTGVATVAAGEVAGPDVIDAVVRGMDSAADAYATQLRALGGKLVDFVLIGGEDHARSGGSRIVQALFQGAADYALDVVEEGLSDNG